MRALVTAGADIDQADDGGATPLFVASVMSHLPKVQYLVKMGADVNHTSDDGSTPLYAAR